MTTKHFQELTKVILDKISKARDAGQKEYAHDLNDVFANFKRIAKSLDTSKEKVLLTYMLKHIDGITAYTNGHQSQREDVTGRLTDIIVYSMLLWGMIEENNHEKIQTIGDEVI
jgi:hypothetical protein